MLVPWISPGQSTAGAEIADEGAIRSDFVIFGERKGIASFPRWSLPRLFSMNWQKEQGSSRFAVRGSQFAVRSSPFAVRSSPLAVGRWQLAVGSWRSAVCE
ncbi:MAG TPA: hypothetical protein VK673_18610 [Chthoniobacterales bacterium]|nr:hypothetical protein [Chthoniobacterales bacterium]